MDIVHKIESWGDRHHPRLLDIIRIALGVFLLLKGIAFMQNTSALKEIIENHSNLTLSPSVFMIMVYYATFVHLAGGTLIALGLVTRLAAIVQVPVVFAAVFFVNDLQSPLNAELWASVICLALLVVFMIIGSGKLSLENYFKSINE